MAVNGDSTGNVGGKPHDLQQRASLTSGSSTWTTTAVPGVPALRLADGPHGLRVPATGEGVGIGDSHPATCFPPAVGLGSTWNPDLVRRVGAALGREARALGVHVLLGPGINIKRSPLGGRNFEYVSEDPHLTGRIAIGWVEGIQSEGVAATVKHFAANNQETDRWRVSAEIDERALHEIYLAAFEAVVREAGPWAVMAAYNKLNGVHATENKWLLTTVLRDRWGFDGVVMSDWGAVNDRVEALAAGCDLEMPPTGTDEQIAAAVRGGGLGESILDTACARIATLAARTTAGAATATVDWDAHDRLACEAAAEAIVLLKNDDDLLPLDPRDTRRIAVIGEFARTPRYQGGGSSRVNPTRVSNALDAISAAAHSVVEFAAGFRLDGPSDPLLADEAVAVAARSDMVLLFLGLPDTAETEGADRTHLRLPTPQLELLERLGQTDTPVVAIVANGGVVEVSSWQHRVGAVLETWLLGQAGGAAIADVVFGMVGASGRLSETIPIRLEDTPSYLQFGTEHVSCYGEGLYVGYRYYDTLDVPVAYPIGHGLSYSRFDYSDLVVTPSGANRWDVVFTLTNSGPRDAAEVPQLYVAVDEPRPTRPVHELRGFTKVFLAAGESRRIEMRIVERDLSIWDVAAHRWAIPAGDYTIQVGASSRDIRLQTVITSPGDGQSDPLTATSTVGEWLAHPAGREQLRPLFAGMPSDLLDRAPELRTIIEQAPLIKLCTFGLGLTPEHVDRMTAAVHSETESGSPTA